ncbi:hypothetical protein JOQ06_021767, partial [Pogonophryne albipinna]
CSTRLEVTRWRGRTTCRICREDPRGVVDLCCVLNSNDGMDESEQEPIRGLASHRPSIFLPEQRAIAHIHKTAFFLTLNPTENISTSIDGPPPRLKTSGGDPGSLHRARIGGPGFFSTFPGKDINVFSTSSRKEQTVAMTLG